MLHTLHIVAHLTYCCTPYILLHTLNIVAHINFNQNGGHIKTLQVVTPVFSSSNVYRFSTPMQESGGLNLQFEQCGDIMRHPLRQSEPSLAGSLSLIVNCKSCPAQRICVGIIIKFAWKVQVW